MAAKPVPVDQLRPVPGPDHVSQATAVEQARAVAEVAAAVQVAQQNPRDIDTARRALQASCSMLRLAEEAFYDFTQGAKVHGPTVKLAREIGRCWGNFQSGIDELRRDMERGYSEMRAWAWDLETNSRRSTTFVVPHERDGSGAQLTSVRDIRNNNMNWAGRGEREMIRSMVPAWFFDEGIALCQATLERGDGTPIEDRRARVVAAFQKLGVARERIERKLGTDMERWTVYDLAQLTQVHKAISRGAVSIADEFPPVLLTGAELTAGAVRGSSPAKPPPAKAAGGPPADEAPHPADAEGPPASNGKASTTPAKKAPAKKAAARAAAPAGGDGPVEYAPDDDGRPFE